MSVTTITNRATNPSAASTTNFAAVAGTGGTAAIAFNSGASYSGTGFVRVTWSVATTAVSGGLSYTQTGLSASTQYTHQIWVNSSITQKVNLVAQYRNSSHTNVGSSVVGTLVTLTANTWTQITVTATSGAAVTEVVLSAIAGTGGVVWPIGATFDGEAVMIQTGATATTYFDGSFTDGAGIDYAWNGTVNASTSKATAYVPTVTVVAKTDSPCPRVELTITDLATGTTVFNIWRTADGVRKIVRSARNRSTVGSDALIDYEAPLGRPLTYDVEIVSGFTVNAPTSAGTATVNSSTWWIQDPLVPGSAIALQTVRNNPGLPDLTAAAVKNLEYAADVTIIPILGSTEPVALIGSRQLAGNVDFSMFTRAAEATTTLRNLLQQTALLLVRPNGATNNGVPGLAYFASAKPVEQPVNVDFGGTLTRWQLTGDLVAAPTLNVLVPIWTYGNVSQLWPTYQAGQTTLAAKTYLDVLKSPSGV